MVSIANRYLANDGAQKRRRRDATSTHVCRLFISVWSSHGRTELWWGRQTDTAHRQDFFPAFVLVANCGGPFFCYYLFKSWHLFRGLFSVSFPTEASGSLLAGAISCTFSDQTATLGGPPMLDGPAQPRQGKLFGQPKSHQNAPFFFLGLFLVFSCLGWRRCIFYLP